MIANQKRVAEDFIEFCDGLEEAGHIQYARRGRMIARQLIEALGMIEAERSVRQALQERCNTQQAILGKATYKAASKAMTED